jgi:hypothetical protein
LQGFHKFFSQNANFALAELANCRISKRMSEQVANLTPTAEWSKGLTDKQKSAIRREALRCGKTPSELVKEWILDLSAKLTQERPQDAA